MKPQDIIRYVRASIHDARECVVEDVAQDGALRALIRARRRGTAPDWRDGAREAVRAYRRRQARQARQDMPREVPLPDWC